MKIIQINTSSYSHPDTGALCHKVYGLDDKGVLYELRQRRVKAEDGKKMVEQKIWQIILTSKDFCKN